MLHLRRTRRLSRSSRKLTCETLECRSLLAADMILQPSLWQNQTNPFDVNADGVVAPLDALVVINALQANILATSGPVDLPNSVFPDVNGDAAMSESDVDAIFESLTSSSPGVDGSSIYGPMGEPAPEGEGMGFGPAPGPGSGGGTGSGSGTGSGTGTGTGSGTGSGPNPYTCIGLNENEPVTPGSPGTQTTCKSAVTVRCDTGLLPSSPNSFRRSLGAMTNEDENWLPEWIEFEEDEGYSVGGPSEDPFINYTPNVEDTLGWDDTHLEYFRTVRFRAYMQYDKALQLTSNNTPTAGVQHSYSWSYTKSHATTTTESTTVDFSQEIGGVGEKVGGKIGRTVSVSENFGTAETIQTDQTYTVPACSTVAVYNAYMVIEADVEWGYWYDTWNPADYDGFDWYHETATLRSFYYLNSSFEVTSQVPVITTTTTTTTTTNTTN